MTAIWQRVSSQVWDRVVERFVLCTESGIEVEVTVLGQVWSRVFKDVFDEINR